MEFKRGIYKELKVWKTKTNRKPLLLMGARQIGKTTLLKSFGASDYDSYLYLNLEREIEAHAFFEGSKDPISILEKLSLLHGQDIVPHKTLIVLDEIQECRDALIALKYFTEEQPDYHIIGAGSLLGLSIGNDRSFPVGKVEFLDMYPLTFDEYLQCADAKLHKAYHHFLDTDEITAIPQAFYEPLQRSFKEYVLIGGMPEVASHFIENRNIEEAIKTQEQILRAYELDFVKHAEGTTSTKIQRVWNSLPSQLAKENKKFLYRAIRSGARARAYEEAIEWLVQAGLVNKVARVEKAGIPLKAYEDVSAFKLYTFETGLLVKLADLNPQSFIYGDQFFTEFKGSIAENYVAQCLSKTQGKAPYYWTSDGIAEIDFVINYKGHNIPIEVKTGDNTKAKSMIVFNKRYKPDLSVRISNKNLSLDGKLLNIPLFYTERADVFLSRALELIG